GLTGTALAPAASKQAGSSAPVSGAAAGSAGLGTANSPQENQLIAELVAPTMGISPSSFPDWSSLLLGPALRGAVVSVK
ncbi:MAG: ABC transporter substrate-binding protein, partial [Jatrophihabitantaceae bacterium]